MIGTKNIINYYKEIHALKRYGNYNLMEINSMYPYELEVYSVMTIKALDDERENLKN